MEDVQRFEKKADEKGDVVRGLKAEGKPIEAALEDLKAAKSALEAKVKELLVEAEKRLEELQKGNGDQNEVSAQNDLVTVLRSKLPEDKKAKTKREKEEQKKKKQQQQEKEQKQKSSDEKLSKKELNKLKRKEAKKKGKEVEKSDAPSPAQAETVVSTPASAREYSTTPSPIPGFDLLAELLSNVTRAKSSLKGQDVAARYLARKGGFYDGSPEELAQIDQWIAFSNEHFSLESHLLKTLDQHLLHQSYMATSNLSLADFAVWAALCHACNGAISKIIGISNGRTNLLRWLDSMNALDGVMKTVEVYQKVLSDPKGSSPHEGAAKPKAKKTFKLPPLKDAVDGKVITRFPPEPSGHLHIGHFKAIFMNQSYANMYNGKMLLRFDDTNPDTEKEEYEDGILEDIKALGVEPSQVSHTSDHFDVILKCAIKLIKQGDAYMDDTPQEQMSEQRRGKMDSKRRGEPMEKNLVRFLGLVFGPNAPSKAADYDCGSLFENDELSEMFNKEVDNYQDWALRAKIGMQHKNDTMRDPVVYRGNDKPHHARTKNKYNAYPTYDLACPVVDSIEGVTHALRDIQYRKREELYMWFFPKLGLRPVEIQDFSRMNFKYTLMSKRKLKWFVENKIASGWDDPRFPTVKGVIRRGMNVEALREFNLEQGSSKNTITMEYDKFWALNKKIIEPTAPRFMGIGKDTKFVINVLDADGKPFQESWHTEPLHPKNPEIGIKTILRGPRVFVEAQDMKKGEKLPEVSLGENIILFSWGVMVVQRIDGEKEITVQFDPNGNVKTPKRKLQWVTDSPHLVEANAHEFDFLITKEKLEENDNFEDFINKNSHAITTLLCEPAMRNVKEGSFLQLMRRSFYRVDKGADLKGPIDIITIPDGKQKAMSTLSGQLTHR